MTIIKLVDVTHYFSGKLVFQNISFEVNKGTTLGLIGDNGCGKSTLLKMIQKEIIPFSGDVIVDKKARISKLNQYPQFSNEKVYDELKGVFKDILECEKEIKSFERKLKTNKVSTDLKKYYKLLDLYQQLGGYVYEHKIEKAIQEISWDKSFYEKKVINLSGGEKTRLELAKLLLQNPNVLLLDEPTNHMDSEGLDWLHSFISNFSGAIVVVSHDRELLDKVCDEIVEIDNKSSMHFSGNYSFYKKEKEKYIETQRAIHKKQKQKIDSLKEEIDSRQSWFQKGQRTKDKDGNELRREVKHHMRTQSAKQAKIVKSKEKTLEKMQNNMVDYYSDKHKIRLNFENNLPIGSDLITIKSMTKQYGSNIIFKNISLSLKTGSKIALVGKNGSGKTTLIKMLLGIEKPTEGLIKLGKSIKPAYLDQELTNLDNNKSALDQLVGINDIKISQARYLLARLHIYAEKAIKPVKQLSIGERMLVAITKLLIDDFNLLILDEPTNHLDIRKREVLEYSLKEYPGSIIFVSHDRYFAKALSDEVIYIENKKVKHFKDSYTNFIKFVNIKENGNEDLEDLKKELLLLKMNVYTSTEPQNDEEQLEIIRKQKRIKELEVLIANK